MKATYRKDSAHFFKVKGDKAISVIVYCFRPTREEIYISNDYKDIATKGTQKATKKEFGDALLLAQKFINQIIEREIK